MRVSPAAPAATTLKTGIRSGIGAASISTARSSLRRMCTAPSCSLISAPKRRSTSSTARSPWEEAGFKPVTCIPRPLSAPAARKKAALDQSPSTASVPGRAGRCEPGIV